MRLLASQDLEHPHVRDAVHEMFRQLHCGEGHRPCDAATARRARKRSLDASSPDRRPGKQPTGDRQSALSS